jgi:hypothetical protein
MLTSKDIKPGNFLDLYTNSQDTEFVNKNEEMKDVLKDLNVRVYQGTLKVVSIEENKINGLPLENFEPIFINSEWLSKLNASAFGQNNVQIGELYFKRSDIGLIYCNANFEPIAEQKIIRYVHQLQNLYEEK